MTAGFSSIQRNTRGHRPRLQFAAFWELTSNCTRISVTNVRTDAYGYETIQPALSISFGKPVGICSIHRIHRFCRHDGNHDRYVDLVLILPLSYPMLHVLCGAEYANW